MSHKLGICIPYRNRKEHVERLIPHLTKYLTEKGIDHKFYVGHQIDDKLFNRGSMKNIAAHYAFEDGCDYIAWHDVDMLSEDKDGLICDYSYPEENPIHIATKLSKYNYGLGYDQYFGGVVLFTKEQAEKTNGYSNDYWDWGQEDDDLFWRCYFENYTTGTIYKSYENKSVVNFNGENALVVIPTNQIISDSLSNNHTISVLFKAEQQQEKVPIWLVGDKEKKFIEYPILRKHDSWTWGLSFNNSRTVMIPRMPLTSSDTGLPFQLKRIQFPIRPAFCMTISKSQGQTLDFVGLWLNEPLFTHGQLYVAMSKVSAIDRIKIAIFENKNLTRNVVFKEVLT